jgi:hypothetical protein
MSMRLPTMCLLAFSVLAAGPLGNAPAKPPDLPVDQQLKCEELITGSVLFGFGVSSDAGLTGSVVFTAPATGRESCPCEDGAAFRAVCPFLDQCFGTCWAALIEGLTALAEHGSRVPSPGCPYVKGSGVASGRAPAAPDLSRGVLENLQRLEAAEALCRAAERHARAGRFDEACRCYDEVCQLCPGSRHEREAVGRLRELYALRRAGVDLADAEEQEAIPPPREITPELIPAPVPVDIDGDYTITVEEQSARTEAESRSFWHGVLGAILDGGCAEFDSTRTGCVRARCQFRVGGVELRIVVNPASYRD